VNTCDYTGGGTSASCDVVITSDEAGTTVISATSDIPVDGVSITRSTDGSVTPSGLTNSGPAEKIWEAPPGGEGCTPGFWKQEQHFDSWVGFSPDQKFSEVFGVDITLRAGGRATIEDPTLLQALEANGGGINALARHAVAALLNASNPDVSFGFTADQVIQKVQDAIDNPDTMEAVKNELAAENERGCPLS
jgi:hypothetical protein